MAFINEEIPENEKKQFSDATIWKKPGGGRLFLDDWTVDRDRDVFLFHLGGGRPEVPEFFAMSWHGEVSKFSASGHAIGDQEVGVEVWWKIFDINIPSSLQSKREEVLELIKEGLDAFGWVRCSDRTIVKTVHITMDE